MLMALANADRCSDLAALDLNHRTFQGGGVRFIIPGLTKTRKSGPPVEAFYPTFPEDPKICPVETLICYENRSKPFQGHANEKSGNPLPVSPETQASKTSHTGSLAKERIENSRNRY